jgi:hypothetical protein
MFSMDISPVRFIPISDADVYIADTPSPAQS